MGLSIYHVGTYEPLQPALYDVCQGRPLEKQRWMARNMVDHVLYEGNPAVTQRVLQNKTFAQLALDVVVLSDVGQGNCDAEIERMYHALGRFSARARDLLDASPVETLLLQLQLVRELHYIDDLLAE